MNTQTDAVNQSVTILTHYAKRTKLSVDQKGISPWDLKRTWVIKVFVV
nr:MAG TPA: hypothetical protein [Caudoviricetes sp.]DAQ07611.1 MAG TPA: hypothetical protein [Caudoviricetes sp.]